MGASFGSLSDGFGGTSTYGLWDAPAAAGRQLSSYRLVAGADFSAADFRRVVPLSKLAAASGSLLLGANSPPLPIPSNPNSPNNLATLRQNVVPNYYEVIRTGTGSIDIAAGRDVLLLNPLAAIYTVGTQAPAMGNFDVPQVAIITTRSPVRTSKRFVPSCLASCMPRRCLKCTTASALAAGW